MAMPIDPWWSLRKNPQGIPPASLDLAMSVCNSLCATCNIFSSCRSSFPFSFYPFFSPCCSSFIWISENQSRFGLKNSFLTVPCVMRAIFKCRDALLDPGITGKVETFMEDCCLSLISVSLNVMVTIFGVSCLEEWVGEGILREVGAVGASVKDSRTYKLWSHDW